MFSIYDLNKSKFDQIKWKFHSPFSLQQSDTQEQGDKLLNFFEERKFIIVSQKAFYWKVSCFDRKHFFPSEKGLKPFTKMCIDIVILVNRKFATSLSSFLMTTHSQYITPYFKLTRYHDHSLSLCHCYVLIV